MSASNLVSIEANNDFEQVHKIGILRALRGSCTFVVDGEKDSERL